jgi:hypothetical protein
MSKERKLLKGGNVMKKYLFIVILLIPSLVFAADLKRNAYQVSLRIHEGARQQSAFMPTGMEARMIYVLNGDSTYSVWVVLTGEIVENPAIGTEGAVELKAGDSISLDNFNTSGVTVRYKDHEASPITVILTY